MLTKLLQQQKPMGLVEFGVGVIPGGGGSKEMALRASDLFHKNDVELNVLQEYFFHCYGKVSTSGYEAFDSGLYKRKRYHCCKQDKLLKLRSMLY
jgi:enoyl-CoA hydratase/carnithine racemase